MKNDIIISVNNVKHFLHWFTQYTHLIWYNIKEVGAVIKRELKRHQKTLTEFCDDFNISRPTLNTYINLYEQEESLPNEVFQRIFDYLFDQEVDEKEEFEERYRYVQDYYHRKYTNRFTNDLLGYNNASERNYNALLMTIERDMVEKNITDDKFMMINYILKNDDELLDRYIDFFMCHQGTKKFNASKYRDNKIIVLLYKALKGKNKTMSAEDYDTLNEFIKENNQKYNNNTPKKYNRTLSKKLANMIEEKYGYVTEEELEHIIKELSTKLNNEVT